MMTMERRGFQEANHVYSIKLIDGKSEPRIYQVKITGAASYDFFVEITPSQNVRNKVEKGIEEWCKRNFDKLPKDGLAIAINLDENRRE
jgi:hypothetical protein